MWDLARGLSKRAGLVMKGTVGLYMWACILGYVTWGGAALPTILGKELVLSENDGPGIFPIPFSNRLVLGLPMYFN